MYKLADMRRIHFLESREMVAANNTTKSDTWLHKADPPAMQSHK
jgi:hypothetical protein